MSYLSEIIQLEKDFKVPISYLIIVRQLSTSAVYLTCSAGRLLFYWISDNLHEVSFSQFSLANITVSKQVFFDDFL